MPALCCTTEGPHDASPAHLDASRWVTSEQAVLDQLARLTDARNPWWAARVLFGRPR